MKKRIVSLGVVISLIFLMIPVGNTISDETFAIQPWEIQSRENTLMSHVIAKGNGTCFS